MTDKLDGVKISQAQIRAAAGAMAALLKNAAVNGWNHTTPTNIFILQAGDQDVTLNLEVLAFTALVEAAKAAE